MNKPQRNKRTDQLAGKMLSGDITAEEREEFEQWYRSFDDTLHEQPSAETVEELQARLHRQILDKAGLAKSEERPKIRYWPRVAVAASVLIMLSAGLYFLNYKAPGKPEQVASIVNTDLPPGSRSAVLELADNRQIILNDAKAGTLARQGGTRILKTADNKVIYQTDKVSSEVLYNKVTTKRGNYYPITLSDGTVAILDAGSSIRYPATFTGNERRVEITGQVYFEVKHNAKMPFRVSVKGQVIEDLGTSFNVNAYDDEPGIKTTLIEGSIMINNRYMLLPGQQAIVANGNVNVEKADIEQAIAWKNGRFKFNETPIVDVMRQLSRWYDVKIEYPDGLPKTVFSGGMYRDLNASQVLDILRFCKVRFEIKDSPKGKKILVKP